MSRLNQTMHTFSIIAKAHLCLAKANCIFSLADAIEFLKLCLVDALNELVGGRRHLSSPIRAIKANLAGKIDLNSLYAHILRTG